MTTNEKLSLLREKMAEAGVQAYLVPSSDPHISEYLPDHWRARAWLSGFDGSAGTLVVTETESGLWTDGRYFIQAERQMAGSEIVLYRMKEKGVPTIQEFLLSRLKKGQVLGIDGMVTAPGKEGKLGVEGMKPEVILEALRRAGATFLDKAAEPTAEKTPITKADLMEWGLAGGAGSNQRRQALLRRLELPEHLTANGMLEALNLLTDREELERVLTTEEL